MNQKSKFLEACYKKKTCCNASFSSPKNLQEINNKQNIINHKNNLSNIIRGFKASCTKLIHIKGFNNFQWQTRFYENIIRDEKSLENISSYIKNNPVNWLNDENNF